MTINPMQSAHDAPRCTAKSKRTGKRCRAPAVRGFSVCRMHGARGGAPSGKWELSARHAHKRGDPSSEVRQLAVALGAQILKVKIKNRQHPAMDRVMDMRTTSLR